MTKDFNQKEVIRDLKINARAVGIPAGAAEVFIEKTLKAIEKDLKSKQIITETDLDRLIAREMQKYNRDLAYVYKIRDKII